MIGINEKPKVLISWSGGKDCCFALYKAIITGMDPVSLFTSMPGTDNKTFGHGLGNDILIKQAEAIGLPIDISIVNTNNYRSFFLDVIEYHKETNGISGMVFGDLYLMEHRTWLENVCKEANITPYFPLWMKKEDAYSALLEFINLKFESILIKLRNDYLNEEWLGKKIDLEFALQNKDKICPMGENGEFHSLVINGPLFKFPLHVSIAGKTRTDKETGLILKL